MQAAFRDNVSMEQRMNFVPSKSWGNHARAAAKLPAGGLPSSERLARTQAARQLHHLGRGSCNQRDIAPQLKRHSAGTLQSGCSA